MKIGVIGTGYVGLVTGVCFAELGHDVTCVDIDHERVARLCAGDVPIHEPGLPEMLARNIARNRMHFSTSTAAATAGAHAVFIAVGTPSQPDGSCDLSGVFEAAAEIGRSLDRFTVVVTKSTVPVGTTKHVEEIVASNATRPFAVASNPEFLKEGDAIADVLRPARVVVGAHDQRAIDLLRDLYRSVLRTGDRMVVMSIESSELTKYAANAMLATRISFMNELSRLAEHVGADIESVRAGIASDPRIGAKFLFAGPGFGGSCFPKDLRALVHTGRENDVHLTIVEAVDKANEVQKRSLGRRVQAHFGTDLKGRRIAVWGLAFKPQTDDIREAPALVLIEQLLAAGAEVVAYDPEAMPAVREMFGDEIELAPDAYAAATGADAVVLVTEWLELRDPDLERLKATMRTHVLFDGRNQWSPAEVREAGFVYHGTGRP
jgi:UDPglucose 6-dehydrogenase